MNDKNGYIKIYRVPDSPEVAEYCIGGDTAGDGSDSFVGQVLNAKTGEQAAVLKHRFDSDQYAKQMFCLGRYYKNALIGIEANFDSYPIMELQRLKYPSQYIREVQDTYTGRTEKRFGFKTTSLTRPTIISRLIEIIREHCDRINDRETLEELLTIVKNEKGRIEAPVGEHDDMMMALAIAYQVMGQVILPNEVIIPERRFNFGTGDGFGRENDYGEKIEIF